jgi:glycosyltransferase involved in cell wall biosynthesis
MSALLIADGLIATTAIAERVLREAYGDVQVVTAESLHGVSIADRPVFISRLCHPRYSWLSNYFRERGVPYVYLLDDNFFELTVDYDASNGAFFSHPAVHESLTTFLLGAAEVWLMSKPLETYLRNRIKGLRTRFIPAPVDIDLFDQSALAAVNSTFARTDSTFTVGYPTTRRLNVAALLSDIVRLVDQRASDSIRFEFIGWCPDAIAAHPNVTVFPATDDYASFLALMFSRRWDAAIAPLGSSLFENCKTNLKYREYGAARLPAIYSDCALFAACVTPSHNGLLASDHADDWTTQIITLRDDPALRARLQSNARTDVENTHAQSAVAVEIRETFAPLWRAS